MEHRAKTSALIAYASGLLSDEGRRRLEKHLEGCEVCREELAAIEMYDSLVEDVRSSQLPQIDFESMEIPLAREAAAVSRTMQAQQRRRSFGPWIALAVAAAAGLGIWAWSQQRAPETPVARPEAPDEAPESPAPIVAEPALLEPVVTLAAGDTRRGEAPVALGAMLSEGDRLATGESSELHVRLSDGTGLRIAAATEVALERTREDAVRVALVEGAVAQQVAHLETGSSFVVLSAGYQVEVTGTRFVVSHVDGVVGVDLSEGSIRIQPPEGDAFELRAPARWRSRGGAPDGTPDAPTIRAVEAPRIAPTPVTLADSRIVRWSVDGAEVATSGPVSIGLAPGEHEVRGWDARGRLFTVLLPVGDAPVELDPGALTPEAPRIRPGHLDEEQLRPVITRGARQVQRCYELALRQGEQSSIGRARVRLDIGVMGDVARVRVLDLPEGALSQCIANYAQRWTFPPPGGPLTIEQPFSLTPTR
ncbi:MAG: AgmX/PglI C-terminal domain-containing protein [Myxococcales bacterium]|nr:AgmX/PglI C-terminal domain-containing protein [Myxococcales bacterium]